MQNINIDYLKTLFNSLTFDCWAMDLDRKYIFQNEKSKSNWGDTIGLSIFDLKINKVLQSEWNAQLDKVFQGQNFCNDYFDEESKRFFQSTITSVYDCQKIIGVIGYTLDITDLKNDEKKYYEKNEELERLNTALHVLLEKRQKDLQSLEEKLVQNIHMKIFPYIKRLSNACSESSQEVLIKNLETALKNILLDYPNNYNQILSTAERQVMELIQQGHSSKEVSNILSVSKSTIDTHRNNIRKKLGLKKSGSSLKQYLQNL